MFFELWSITANVVPRCFRTNEDVLLNFDTRISIYAAKSHAVYVFLEHAA